MVSLPPSNRIVITGLGIVSPIGIGKDAFWAGLSEGRSAIRHLSSIPNANLFSKMGAEILDFQPEEHLYHKKLIKVMSRDMQLGVASASMAYKDSGVGAEYYDPEKVGVVFGSGHISTTPQELIEAARESDDPEELQQMTRWGEDRMGKIPPLWLLKQLPNMPACHVAIEHNAQGPNNTITSRESSALLALGEARRTILRGAADCMIVGACSSPIDPIDLARLNLFESLSRREDEPHKACRPFDRDRDGTVLGEGAATFVLETYENALRRGANIYGELLAVGAGCDTSRVDQPGKGEGLSNAINQCLKQSRIEPREIGHINAHGKSTQWDDYLEAQAYRRSFGDVADTIPVIGLSSYFGSFDAGTGAVELAGSLLALNHAELPMTLNYDNPDPRCKLNVVGEPSRRLSNSLALSVNRTNLGQSAACLIRTI